MRGFSGYNTIIKRFREEIFEWILSLSSDNSSCIISDVFTVFNPKSNIKEVFPKILMRISIRGYTQIYD